jgi:hypothetical protein
MKLIASTVAIVVTLAGATVHAESSPVDDPNGPALALATAVLGDGASDAATRSDADSVAILVESGTHVDVPRDPADGMSIDTPRGGVDVIVTPTDGALGGFERVDGVMSAAVGSDYVAIAEPLEGGDFRMAVVLEDASAPTSLSYSFDLRIGVTPQPTADGGYSFVDASGQIVGGLAAPWALDANGHGVPVAYSFEGNTLTRIVTPTAETAFPVVTNWCLFGKNPNGSCRGASLAKQAAAAVSAGWLTRAVCLTGALGLGAPTAGLGAVGVAALCSAAGFGVGYWASRNVR